MTPAAIYCRSSKDKAEVGLAAQTAELEAFAKAKGFAIVKRFSDMEVSGKRDEASRPGLRDMLAALADKGRTWEAILALDTSRIARDPMLALYITRAAEKRSVAIHYAKLPLDGSTAHGNFMLGILREVDNLHSRLSADRGRGGLEANVALGYRAGGAAPFGYKLAHTETGAMRGGAPVRKSKLVLDSSAAAKVRVFLKARADGAPRHAAATRAKLDKAVASLIAIERNALTYAGFTVWNMRQKIHRSRESKQTMRWRPRAEWIISEKPTHDGLITRAEAERILAAVDVHHPKPAAPRVRKPEAFILSGLLFTPQGVQWHGDTHDSAYRAGVKGKRANKSFVEGEVLARIAADFADKKFLTRTIAEARRMAAEIEADPLAIDGEIKKAERRLANLLDMAADSGNKALLARIQETEAAVQRLRDERAAWAERKALQDKLAGLTERDLVAVLGVTVDKIKRGTGELATLMYGREDATLDPAELRRVVTSLVERVELDPDTRELTVRYRIPLTAGVKRATPRGFEPWLPP